MVTEYCDSPHILSPDDLLVLVGSMTLQESLREVEALQYCMPAVDSEIRLVQDIPLAAVVYDQCSAVAVEARIDSVAVAAAVGQLQQTRTASEEAVGVDHAAVEDMPLAVLLAWLHMFLGCIHPLPVVVVGSIAGLDHGSELAEPTDSGSAGGVVGSLQPAC